MAGCKKSRGANRPKMKSSRSAKKRFSITGSGKVKFKRKNLKHNLSNKNRKHKRNLGKSGIMTSSDAGLVIRHLSV